MKISHIALSAALLASGTHGFMMQRTSYGVHSASTPLFLEPSALTEYMAKAHEDKLKAVQQIEAKKNEEIEALRAQLTAAQQQASSSSSAITPAISGNIADMSKEEMAQKLVAYQQFMSKYIVEAQRSKAKAVFAAENAMRQKYEDKLLLLQATPKEAQPSPVQAAPAPVSVDTKLYQERSEKVSAAAKAGKSRWGDMENQRAAQAATAVAAPAPIIEQVKETAVEVQTIGDRSLYDKRIAMVAAAGKAGKSRWGEMEVMKATAAAAVLPSSSAAAPVKTSPEPVTAPTISVPPEVAEADHGMRNDGGVGGPSLAERINLGAQLLQQESTMISPAPAPVAASAVSPALSLFERRNIMVVAAAKAGKSRWGEFEVLKAKSIAATLPSASEISSVAVAVATPPEVLEADHGLRNDGGVGGPSLADRVNLGASLLGQ